MQFRDYAAPPGNPVVQSCSSSQTTRTWMSSCQSRQPPTVSGGAPYMIAPGMRVLLLSPDSRLLPRSFFSLFRNILIQTGGHIELEQEYMPVLEMDYFGKADFFGGEFVNHELKMRLGFCNCSEELALNDKKPDHFNISTDAIHVRFHYILQKDNLFLSCVHIVEHHKPFESSPQYKYNKLYHDSQTSHQLSLLLSWQPWPGTPICSEEGYRAQKKRNSRQTIHHQATN